MRFFVALVVNFLLLIRTSIGLPFRLLRSRRRPRYVRFLLRGDPPYRERMHRRWRMFERRDPAEVRSLHELREQLQTIANDSRARGAVLVIDRVAMAPAKVAAIAELCERFRAAGKELVGYAVHPGNSEYELLCAAERMIFSPAARLDLTGFAAEATAVATGLRRFGISAQFVRRGEYKTAPELFTETTVSEIHRQTLERILDQRYQALLARIGQARNLTIDEARRRVDEGPYSAKRALAAGLCDALCSESDLGTWLSTSAEERERLEAGETPRLPNFAAYRNARPFPPIAWRPLKRRPRISIVPVNGIIAEGDGGRAPIGPEIAGSDAVVSAIRSARRDPRSAALVLYVNSPGGSALASELILEEVRRAARKKPVVAYFDRVAASGGYMAALGANEIWAAPEAIAGSIGVFGGKFDFSQLFERLGIHRTLITRGENSGLFSPSRPFTDHERRTMEAEIEEAYQDFLEQVSRARGKSKEEIHARAEGRVYSGKDAAQAGLLDRTGSFEDACRRALELAKAPSERFDVAIQRVGKRRVPLIGLVRQLQPTGIFALWLEGIERMGWIEREPLEEVPR